MSIFSQISDFLVPPPLAKILATPMSRRIIITCILMHSSALARIKSSKISPLRGHSFAIRSAYIWNHLPNEVKKAINLHIFRSKIEKVDFSRFLRGRT